MRDGLPRLGVPMQTPVLNSVSAPLNFCATIIETWYARTAVIAREDLRTGGSMGGWTHREEGSGSSAVSRGNEVTAIHGVTGGLGGSGSDCQCVGDTSISASDTSNQK